MTTDSIDRLKEIRTKLNRSQSKLTHDEKKLENIKSQLAKTDRALSSITKIQSASASSDVPTTKSPSTIKSLQLEINDKEQEIKQLRKSIASLQTIKSSIPNLQRRIVVDSDNIRSLQTQVDRLSQTVKTARKMDDEIKHLQQQFHATKALLKQAKEEIGSLQNAKKAMKTASSKRQRKLAVHIDRVQSLTKSLKQQQSKLKGKTQTRGKLQPHIDDYQSYRSQLIQLHDAVNEIKDQLHESTNTTASIESHQGQLSQTKKQYLFLKSQLRDCANNNSAIKKTIMDLRRDKVKLKATIDRMEQDQQLQRKYLNKIEAKYQHQFVQCFISSSQDEDAALKCIKDTLLTKTEQGETVLSPIRTIVNDKPTPIMQPIAISTNGTQNIKLILTLHHGIFEVPNPNQVAPHITDYPRFTLSHTHSSYPQATDQLIESVYRGQDIEANHDAAQSLRFVPSKHNSDLVPVVDSGSKFAQDLQNAAQTTTIRGTHPQNIDNISFALASIPLNQTHFTVK
jgi:DNA repair exonuclease SbcCD ATPase subunit